MHRKLSGKQDANEGEKKTPKQQTKRKFGKIKLKEMT